MLSTSCFLPCTLILYDVFFSYVFSFHVTYLTFWSYYATHLLQFNNLRSLPLTELNILLILVASRHETQ